MPVVNGLPWHPLRASSERRLEPRTTIGLRTDATGFALTVYVFEGDKAGTATMLPHDPGALWQLTGLSVHGGR